MENLIITNISSALYYDVDTWQRPNMLTRNTNGIVFLFDGEIEYEDKNGKFNSKSGDIILFPKGYTYKGKKLTERHRFIVVNFDTNIPLLHESFNPIFKSEKNLLLQNDFYEIVKYANDNTKSGMLLAYSKLYKILGCTLGKRKEDDIYSPFMQKIITYISENLQSTELSFSSICKEFNISTSQLRRDFHKETGTSPVKYITSKRIELAKKYLTTGNISVKEIAELCGFSSDFYFCRVFKEATGKTPKEFVNEQ